MASVFTRAEVSRSRTTRQPLACGGDCRAEHRLRPTSAQQTATGTLLLGKLRAAPLALSPVRATSSLWRIGPAQPCSRSTGACCSPTRPAKTCMRSPVSCAAGGCPTSSVSAQGSSHDHLLGSRAGDGLIVLVDQFGARPPADRAAIQTPTALSWELQTYGVGEEPGNIVAVTPLSLLRIADNAQAGPLHQSHYGRRRGHRNGR
jgi:hypothetical protein